MYYRSLMSYYFKQYLSNVKKLNDRQLRMMVFILKNATDYYIHKSLHNHMLVSQFCYKNRNKNSIAHLQFIESHIPWIKKKLKAGRISHCTINRNPNKTVVVFVPVQKNTGTAL